MPLSITFDERDQDLVALATAGRGEDAEAFRLHLTAERLALLEGFEDLLCLPLLRGVTRYPHQERTALRVMRRLRGRAILGDEVGLGKTIEPCLIAREYLLRGMAARILVLCPPSLAEQWRVELEEKFGIAFVTHADPEFRAMGADAWAAFPRVVASPPTARLPRNAAALRECGADLLVVDEAHHLHNRNASAWRLIHDMPRKYLLLLTATPVQNDLEELYNLITPLRPGQLGTPAEFRRRFVDGCDRRRPRDVHALRELMLDVMIRNTRGQVDVALPPRRSRTQRVAPSAEERALLDEVAALVRREWGQRRRSAVVLTTLQLEAGSSPAALAGTLEKLGENALAARAKVLGLGAKSAALLDILHAMREPCLVFTRFAKTLEALSDFLARARLRIFQYYGGLSPQERESALRRFEAEGGVLLLSDVGGEGKNLQFCRNMINFDLPWNPMRIEQRVGRLHRIGQRDPIRIVNLCLEGSLEDHLLRILDEKLNMFELVVGELETILGPLGEDHGGRVAARVFVVELLATPGDERHGGAFGGGARRPTDAILQAPTQSPGPGRAHEAGWKSAFRQNSLVPISEG